MRTLIIFLLSVSLCLSAPTANVFSFHNNTDQTPCYGQLVENTILGTELTLTVKDEYYSWDSSEDNVRCLSSSEAGTCTTSVGVGGNITLSQDGGGLFIGMMVIYIVAPEGVVISAVASINGTVDADRSTSVVGKANIRVPLINGGVIVLPHGTEIKLKFASDTAGAVIDIISCSLSLIRFGKLEDM